MHDDDHVRLVGPAGGSEVPGEAAGDVSVAVRAGNRRSAPVEEITASPPRDEGQVRQLHPVPHGRHVLPRGRRRSERKQGRDRGPQLAVARARVSNQRRRAELRQPTRDRQIGEDRDGQRCDSVHPLHARIVHRRAGLEPAAHPHVLVQNPPEPAVRQSLPEEDDERVRRAPFHHLDRRSAAVRHQPGPRSERRRPLGRHRSAARENPLGHAELHAGLPRSQGSERSRVTNKRSLVPSSLYRFLTFQFGRRRREGDARGQVEFGLVRVVHHARAGAGLGHVPRAFAGLRRFHIADVDGATALPGDNGPVSVDRLVGDHVGVLDGDISDIVFGQAHAGSSHQEPGGDGEYVLVCFRDVHELFFVQREEVVEQE